MTHEQVPERECPPPCSLSPTAGPRPSSCTARGGSSVARVGRLLEGVLAGLGRELRVLAHEVGGLLAARGVSGRGVRVGAERRLELRVAAHDQQVDEGVEAHEHAGDGRERRADAEVQEADEEDEGGAALVAVQEAEVGADGRLHARQAALEEQEQDAEHDDVDGHERARDVERDEGRDAHDAGDDLQDGAAHVAQAHVAQQLGQLHLVHVVHLLDEVALGRRGGRHVSADAVGVDGHARGAAHHGCCCLEAGRGRDGTGTRVRAAFFSTGDRDVGRQDDAATGMERVAEVQYGREFYLQVYRNHGTVNGTQYHVYGTMYLIKSGGRLRAALGGEAKWHHEVSADAGLSISRGMHVQVLDAAAVTAFAMSSRYQHGIVVNAEGPPLSESGASAIAALPPRQVRAGPPPVTSETVAPAISSKASPSSSLRGTRPRHAELAVYNTTSHFYSMHRALHCCGSYGGARIGPLGQDGLLCGKRGGRAFRKGARAIHAQVSQAAGRLQTARISFGVAIAWRGVQAPAFDKPQPAPSVIYLRRPPTGNARVDATQQQQQWRTSPTPRATLDSRRRRTVAYERWRPTTRTRTTRCRLFTWPWAASASRPASFFTFAP
ncbi:hypothetical protein ON010_g3304 [Phytophthora cinnamomi]|nr:hypothetical protein ON010_g3304 [Phytophthora cinnamomi]